MGEALKKFRKFQRKYPGKLNALCLQLYVIKDFIPGTLNGIFKKHSEYEFSEVKNLVSLSIH